ncbi:helix-turn-helix domain-containing protein [Thermococcus sp.]|uniref:sulfur metabolism transcriptional regulator SurR n=1 Tax=Thermococcus sp. TaxID=35749 RepID=UPI0025D9777C|nr:helix-turn-helix domain-containing protein [Thermococcus sp.]
MTEPDIFYILGNKVRRDLLSHLTCTECYFSFLSSKVSVSSTAVAKHLKIMEREGILRSHEKEGPFIGPARKYYDISISRTYVATVTPNVFWYRGLNLTDSRGGTFSIKVNLPETTDSDLPRLVTQFLQLNRELEKVLQALKSVERGRDLLMNRIKERYLHEIGDMTQLAILHYLLTEGNATVDELSDRLNLKEREVVAKAEELARVIPLKIKEGVIEIDVERLQSEGEEHGGEG